MISIIRNNLRRFFQYRSSKSYWSIYNQIKEVNPHLLAPVENENEWYDKWSKYGVPIKKDSFRIFSKFVGNDMNLIPLEFFPTLIEPVLNPLEMRRLSEEKNYYDIIYGTEFLPKTIFRNINKEYYNDLYEKINNVDDFINTLTHYNTLVIKPTVDSGSGKDVTFFTRVDNIFRSKEGVILNSKSLINKFGKDFICQEVIHQSSFISKFNPSSLNTIRLMVYKSVIDNTSHVLNCVLRVGANGALVDNAYAGGKFCGINDEGVIGNYFCDRLGNKSDKFNSIDLSQNEYIIPNFNLVKEMAVKVSSMTYHSRLLALDLILDENNLPKLIEVNASGFAGWFYSFTNGSYFKNFTEEVVNYCTKEINNNTLRNL